jgi:PII-like signaling protein
MSVEMIERDRLEVLVDAPLARKIVELSRQAGITGHTLSRTASGEGRGGEWQEDLLTGATAKFIFLAVANRERADRFIELVTPLLETHGLLVLRSPVDVVRSDRF